MSKHVHWLRAEVEQWTAEGIVTPEQAARLRERYALPAAEGPPWGLLVFASAGALVIGLGVILLFAYNWAAIPKPGKLGLVFAAIAGAHAGGLVLLRRGGWRQRLGEAFSLLGTMFFGAGIWLVAQVYHIDEHFPNGFLLWALGALVMAWALESVAHGMLAAVLLAIWGGTEAIRFRDPSAWALVLTAAALLPLAWRKASGLLLALVLAALEFLLVANLAGAGAQAFAAVFAFGALLIGAARLVEGSTRVFAAAAPILAGFGYAGFIGCCYLLGFEQAADDLLDWSRPARSPNGVVVHSWTLFALGTVAWGTILRQVLRQRRGLAIEDWLVPIGLCYVFGLGAAGLGDRSHAGFIAATFNLILLGLASMWMWRGCNESRLRPTVAGSLLLAAVVLARYFDLFQSLAARGFAFIVLGGIFLAEALYYRRQRRAQPSDAGGSA